MKVAVVTGASRGIGLEFVKQLLKKNYNVAATCRTPENAAQLQALTDERLLVCKLDVTDDASIKQAAEDVNKKFPDGISLLINNAAVGARGTVLTCTREQLLQTFNANTAGVIMTTQSFAPYLQENSTVMNITTGVSSISTISATFAGPYRVSKAALNMATRCMELELADRKIKVFAIHPGWVDTEMGRGAGGAPPLSPEQSAGHMLNVLNTLENKPHATSGYYNWKGDVCPW